MTAMADKASDALAASRAQTTPTSDVVLRITQVRSTIGSKQNQRATLASLGLRKIRQSVERADTPQIRGMIRTVRHLVAVEEVAR